MSWKNSDPQLNLIHILPSETDQSSPQTPEDHGQHLRIQVGDEPPSSTTAYLAKTVSLLRRGIHNVGRACRAGCRACLRGGGAIASALASAIVAVFVLLMRGGSLGLDVSLGTAKRLQQRCVTLWHRLMHRGKRSNYRAPIAHQAVTQQPAEYAFKLEKDELLWEVHALRDQLTAQRNELTRVNTQIGELKALALSQQQVLLHLGKEIESIESKTMRAEKTSHRKSKPKSERSAKSKDMPSSSKSSSAESSMSLGPRR